MHVIVGNQSSLDLPSKRQLQVYYCNPVRPLPCRGEEGIYTEFVDRMHIGYRRLLLVFSLQATSHAVQGGLPHLACRD